mmetsp:Transcript_35253/g.39316  ORF Transcript_35253/g.39316 Transcript_35253/m.39316 type:complete len:164 (-) Transcript_35253:693-1184(-)
MTTMSQEDDDNVGAAGAPNTISGGDSDDTLSSIPMPNNNNNHNVMEDTNPVPFEAVLDTALQFMKKYPPNSLVSIAKVYYHEDWENQLSLLATSIQVQRPPPPPDSEDVEEGVMVGVEPPAVPIITDVDVQQQIVLLNPCPPPWSIVPPCTSDWLKKQKYSKS